MIVENCVRLPLTVDLDPLRSEALALPEELWTPHFNQDIYTGQWSGIALRSVGGEATSLYPEPVPSAPYADTEVLEYCPSFRTFLHGLGCPIQMARLLRLGPGAQIKEHCDSWLSWDDGEIRIHIPIVTSGEVEFRLDGHIVDMAPGEAWYLNLNLPHQVTNGSNESRIHLVLDCVINDWLIELMEIA